MDELPATVPEQRAWFNPYLQDVDRRTHRHYQQMAQNLKRTLVFNNGLSPLGLLRSRLEYSLNDRTKLQGVFESVNSGFKVQGGRDLLVKVTAVNDFRNRRRPHSATGSKRLRRFTTPHRRLRPCTHLFDPH